MRVPYMYHIHVVFTMTRIHNLRVSVCLVWQANLWAYDSDELGSQSCTNEHVMRLDLI